MVAARNKQSGNDVEGQLRSSGIDAMFVSCDVSVEQDMQQLFDRTMERHGRIDCLVNNAGWHPPAQSIEDVSVEEFEKLVRLNLTSTFMGCKFVIPHLRKTRGSIINMSSAVAMMGQASAPSYVSTKAGQIGLTKACLLYTSPSPRD